MTSLKVIIIADVNTSCRDKNIYIPTFNTKKKEEEKEDKI